MSGNEKRSRKGQTTNENQLEHIHTREQEDIAVVICCCVRCVIIITVEERRLVGGEGRFAANVDIV